MFDETKQVVPFTPSAGVLEWVNGTLPLGEYLTGRSVNVCFHPVSQTSESTNYYTHKLKPFTFSTGSGGAQEQEIGRFPDESGETRASGIRFPAQFITDLFRSNNFKINETKG